MLKGKFFCCKKQIVSQHNARNHRRSKVTDNLKWEMYKEVIPDAAKVPVDSKVPAELYGLTKDTTDYAWFTTRYVVLEHPRRSHDGCLRKQILLYYKCISDSITL